MINFTSDTDMSGLINSINSDISVCSTLKYGKKNKKYFISIKKDQVFFIYEYISEWINEMLGIRIVLDIIKKEYSFLTEDEQFDFCHCVIKMIKIKKEKLISILETKLMDVLELGKDISIDGFINFCISDYIEELEIIVENCFEDLMVKKEYYEFLNLLHYYTETEEIGIEELNVYTSTDGKFNFCDKLNQDISEYCRQLLKSNIINVCDNENDLLITILIILLPERINIYGTDNIINKNILRTLEIVFKDKLVLYN